MNHPGKGLARVTTPAFVLATVVLLTGAPRVSAQSSRPTYRQSPVENETLDLYRHNRLITARARAQSALDADPDSLVGHYVMGCVLREAEGLLARAMYHLGRARQIYETRFGQAP